MVAQLKVKDFMSRDLIEVDFDNTVEKASKLLVEHSISSILVTKNGDVVGIITESDILNHILAKNRRPSEVLVQDIMSSPVVTISEDASADEAADKMKKNKLKRLVAVKGNKPIGIFTIADLTKRTATMQKKKFDSWAHNIFEAWNAF